MMRGFLAAGVVLVIGVQLWGALTPEQAKEAQALIGQFGNAEFRVREQAVEKLIAMGLDVLPMVKKTMEETQDNEVKLRCEMVIKGVKERSDRERTLEDRVVKDLGPLPAGRAVSMLNVNGSGIVFEILEGAKRRLVHKGQEGPEYDSILHTAMSRDGEHVAYVGKRGEEWFLVKDGGESVLEGFSWLQLSPDGKHVGLATMVGPGKFRVTLDGNVLGEYEFAFPLMFSEDSKHLAYKTRRGKMSWVLIDGMEGPPHGSIFPIVNAGVLRYVAQDEDDLWLVEMAWPGAGEGKPEKVVEKREKLLGKVQEGHVPLQSAGSDTTGGYYSRFENLMVSRDGEKWEAGRVWLAGDGGHMVWMVEKDGKVAMIRDGKEELALERIHGFVFSVDGAHVAYVGNNGKEHVLMRDGKEAARDPGDRNVGYMGPARLSPDGRLLAYVTGRVEKEVDKESLVCEGREGPEYDRARDLIFSRDGRHLGYVGVMGGKSHLVLDGVSSGSHDSIRLPTVWEESPGKVRYVAIDGKAARLMEAAWPEGMNWTNGMKEAETK